MHRPPRSVLPRRLSPHRRRQSFLFLLASFLLLVSLPAPGAGVTEFTPGFLRYVTGRWGADATKRLLDWQQTVRDWRNQSPSPPVPSRIELGWVRAANSYWNRVPYADDWPHWRVEDYWATPAEMLASNGGDCEDYAIGKYFTLKDLGVPIKKLRITYVRAHNWNQPHMVLAYYPQPEGDPLILDNLNRDLLPASQRDDLEPIYSFNDDDLWTSAAAVPVGKSSQIRLWRDVLRKMENEQRM
jgi:predicted transglutaminase-like cysteine proteinase